MAFLFSFLCRTQNTLLCLDLTIRKVICSSLTPANSEGDPLNSSDPKLHVLHLIGSSGLYGAERWILALMRALDRQAIQTTLMNLVDVESKISDVVVAARQRGLNALDYYTGGTLNPLAALRLARWVCRHRVAIIHGHGFKSDVLGLLAARFSGRKILTTPHGWSLERDKKLRFYEQVDRSIFRFMDTVCPLSPDLEKSVKCHSGATPVRLILNGVDMEEAKSVAPSQRTDQGATVVGYIGQLIERKNLNTLLTAIAKLTKEGHKIRLIVIGNGPQESELKKETARLTLTDQVDFLGFRSDAIALLKSLDVFVLPSLMEGIPRCIMEAMAAGIPVIASAIPGNTALVRNGDTGLLFAPRDSHDLAEKIRHVILHQPEASAMAVRAFQRIDREFSSRRMAAEYHLLYQELAR